MKQITVKKAVTCTGVGLHTGKENSITIYPAPVDQGIVFYKNGSAVPARYDLVSNTFLSTTLSSNGTYIKTVEHLMAALYGLGIDNAYIELQGDEIPAMDGSAAPFVKALEEAGQELQETNKKYMRVLKPFSCCNIKIVPSDVFEIDCRIRYDDELIGRQDKKLIINTDSFINEISSARTFGHVDDIDELWKHGLARGCSLDNVIAIHWDHKSVLNNEGLRYKDEFVRHKMLDIVGDFALSGARILGRVKTYRSGHQQHNTFLRAFFRRSDCWVIE